MLSLTTTSIAACAPLSRPDLLGAVHRNALVIDAHADINDPLEAVDPSVTIDTGSETDVAKLLQGGVDAIFLSVHAPQQERTEKGRQAERKIAEAKLVAIKEIAARHPDRVALATTPAEVRKIAASGRTAIVMSLLNGSPYSFDANALDYLYGQGVRMVGFVHMGNNELADSSRPFAEQKPGENGGLTQRGREWVAQANRLGIMLDVSQLSTPALMQTVALSRAPVIASHSGVRAVVDTSRNLTDEELTAVARSGGAVCVVAFTAYLVNTLPPGVNSERIAYLAKQFTNGYEGMTVEQRRGYYAELKELVPRATVDQYADSIDAAVKKIGINHVCISSDFNHGVTGLQGWRDESESPNITAALLKRGYNARQIDRLWGANVLRVMAKVQSLRQR